MPPIDTIFSRNLLSRIHADIRREFPEIENVTAACGVLRSIGGTWTAEIHTPGREAFHWDGRAANAYEARFKAWSAFAQAHGKFS